MTGPWSTGWQLRVHPLLQTPETTWSLVRSQPAQELPSMSSLHCLSPPRALCGLLDLSGGEKHQAAPEGWESFLLPKSGPKYHPQFLQSKCELRCDCLCLLPKVLPRLEQERFHCAQVLHSVNQQFPAKKDFTGKFLNQIKFAPKYNKNSRPDPQVLQLQHLRQGGMMPPQQ